MKHYCSAANCEAEFDTPALVQVCPDCAVGQDAWRHWSVNAPPAVKDNAGRISRAIYDAVHSIINAEFEGVINVRNIGAAVKLHSQKQANLARQQQEAAENLARQKLLEQEQDIAAKLFVADNYIATCFGKQAARTKTSIFAKIRNLLRL